MPTPSTPVEFTRQLSDGNTQRCGNEVSLDDTDPISVSGAVTIADGADVAEGSTTDAPASSTVVQTAAPMPLVGLVKGILNAIIGLAARIPAALGAGGGMKVEVVRTNTFSQSDSLTRPHNTTAYGANKAINCKCLVTAMSYAGLTVTLTAPNALAVGDYITVSGVNTGFTVTNIDGNWVCKAGTNATTIVFDVAAQPTGTTPQTVTAGAVAKLLSVEVADNAGDGVILSRLSVAIQGVAMIGAVRVYVYTQPTAVLVDQATFTLLNANDTYRKDNYDITLITEGAGSDVAFGAIRLWEVIKCDPSYKRLFFRIVAEGALTPVNDGLVTLRASGVKLGG
jgi:hypothetical protein